MRGRAALFVALAVADTTLAASAYVTDELVLGVYSSPNTEGVRLATLHSGAAVEALSTLGDATQVRLADGITGWVKSAYLITSQPATVRLKLLQDELARGRAITPGVARLTQQRQSEGGGTAVSRGSAAATPPWGWVAGLLGALICGFCLGYATLARRIKFKFGGIRLY